MDGFVIGLTSLFLSFALIRIKARCAVFQGVDFCPSSSTIWMRHGASEITVTAWLALLLAGVLEVVWALSLKATDGLTRFWPLMMTLSTIILSFGLFTFSLKAVPFGTAYAVWAGIGAAGSMIAGMVMFGESADAFRIACLTLIIGGMIGLKLAS